MLGVEAEVVPTSEQHSSIKLYCSDFLQVCSEVLSEEHWEDAGACT